MSDTQTLNYQPPRSADSIRRQLTCRHATANGSAFLVLSVVFAVVGALQAYRWTYTMAAIVTGVIAAWYMVGGILYVIAGVKIIRSNPFWERMLFLCPCINLLVTALLVTIAILKLSASNSLGPVIYCTGFFVVHAIALGRTAFLAAKIYKEA